MKGIVEHLGAYPDTGDLYGIIRADDTTYKFTQYGVDDRDRGMDAFSVGDSVEFELFVNRNGTAVATKVRPEGQAESGGNRFATRHRYGNFNDFLYLNTGKVVRALKKLPLADPAALAGKTDPTVYREVAVLYNSLTDADFVFTEGEGVKAMHFPSGYNNAEGKPIRLYCVENSASYGVPWLCEKVLCDGVVYDGSTVFDLINVNWYDLEGDVKALLPEVTLSHMEILAHVETRCTAPDDIVALCQGKVSTQDLADELYAATGFFAPNGKEVYLLARKSAGVRGYGWYYTNLTYEGASLDIYDKKNWLELWGGAISRDTYEDLANQTLEEQWSFGHRGDYGILKNYLRYTFSHQWIEEAVSYSKDGRFASFNTGLPDRNTYKYLYAFYEKLDAADQGLHPLYRTQEYRFRSFVIPGRGGDGKALSTNIRPLPNPPQYFEARSATVWNLDFNDSNQITTPEYDDKHILIQRCDRLPLEFFAYPASFSENLTAILQSSESLTAKYKKIREYFRPIMENEPDPEVTAVYRRLYDALENVIGTAVKKLSWNWRAVVPCFNPERNEPCYLLPVSFCDQHGPDRAMIASSCEVDGDLIYTIHTVIPLDWAYLDARLVCRPESEWLAADCINENDED